MLFRHSMSIAQQLMPIYNTTVHKNKVNVALNCWVFMKTPTDHKGGLGFMDVKKGGLGFVFGFIWILRLRSGFGFMG